jgi:hypothetical protein
MFMEGRKVAKRHGERGAMRMLEAIPPPYDEDIMKKAGELMAEVLGKTKQPLAAAVELTATIIKIRRQIEPAKDFVRQGADLQAASSAKDDDDFANSIEMINNMLDEEAKRISQNAEGIKL